MTPESINIAIAKTQRYTDPQLCPRRLTGEWADDWRECLDRATDRWGRKVPDYCTDLNAMAQVITTITDGITYGAYLERLRRVVARENSGQATVDCRAMYEARPAQKAEAYLRTLGLWEADSA